jgi:hypothetical protein
LIQDKQHTTCSMLAQGVQDLLAQLAALAQQLTALQNQVSTLPVDNTTLQANMLTNQINAMQAEQPPNVLVVGGTENLTFTVAPLTFLMTSPPPASNSLQPMPPPEITFDEVRGKPTFRRRMKMNDGNELEYGN